MNWLIPKSIYNIWTDFRIETQQNIKFETGCCYHLKGQNGTGKSSFIRKILIPQLQNRTSEQYILYLEQQVQSQFDALKAHAALQKPSVQINSVEHMFSYQLRRLSHFTEKDPRSAIIILDETIYPEIINEWLQEADLEQVCLIYVSHLDYNFTGFSPIKSIRFQLVSAGLSKAEA